MRWRPLLHGSVSALTLLATACGSNAAAPAVSTPTGTPVSSPTATAQPPTARPSPPPTPVEVTAPLHIVDVATGADSLHFVNIGAVSWSPDGTRVAVGSQEELVIVDLASGATRISKVEYFGEPGWSPDSRYLAVPTIDELLVVGSDSGGVELTVKRDTPAPAMGWTYDWSADGKLAVASHGGRVRIWDGSVVSEVTTTALRVWWLEDGRLAVLVARSEQGPGVLSMRDPLQGYAADASLPVLGRLSGFAVSPSGRYGIESREEGWPAVFLRVVDLATGDEVSRIAASPVMPPSPSGTFRPGTDDFLVLTDFCKDTSGLAVASPDGEVHHLADAVVYAAQFSPGGAHVAYTTATELWVVAADGGTPRLLAEGVHGPAGFTWSPDSTRIAYAPFLGAFGHCT